MTDRTGKSRTTWKNLPTQNCKSICVTDEDIFSSFDKNFIQFFEVPYFSVQLFALKWPFSTKKIKDNVRIYNRDWSTC